MPHHKGTASEKFIMVTDAPSAKKQKRRNRNRTISTFKNKIALTERFFSHMDIAKVLCFALQPKTFSCSYAQKPFWYYRIFGGFTIYNGIISP